MGVYNSRQLVVIIVLLPVQVLCLAAGSAVERRANAPVEPVGPGCVYELCGGIRREGIYCFPAQQTLAALVDAGGGLTAADAPVPGSGGPVIASGSRVVFGSGIVLEDADARVRLNFFLPLNLNKVKAEDLALITGIGMATACKVVAYRNENGGIRDVDELIAVKGIGPGRLEALRPFLTAADRCPVTTAREGGL